MSIKTVCNSYEAQVAAFDQQIGDDIASIALLERDKQTNLKVTERDRRRLAYLRFVRWIRLPSKDYSLWRPGLALVGAAIASVFCFVVFDLVSHSAYFTMAGSAVGVITTLSMLVLLLNYPSDAA